jgi:hypothetical protein
MSLEDSMRMIFGGLYAKGHAWIGYQNGTVVMSPSDIVYPLEGTPDADSELIKHKNNTYIMRYVNTEMYVVLVGAKYAFAPLAAATARSAAKKDLAEKIVLMRDL